MLRGHGAVVVGQSIREVCMFALFLEESARLQTEAMRLGTPLFMERDEAEKIANRTFKPSSVEQAGIILQPNAPIEPFALVAHSYPLRPKSFKKSSKKFLVTSRWSPYSKDRRQRTIAGPVAYLLGQFRAQKVPSLFPLPLWLRPA
jgi:hypothetical protein